MKRYLITGASRGIGRAIAEKLANTGIWNVVKGEWPREKMLLPEEIGDAVAYALSRPAEVAVENIDLRNLTGQL